LENGPMSQLTFAGIPSPPERRPRRNLWRAEIARVVAYADDRLVRAEARHTQELARLDGQLADIRDRIVDLERGDGAADLARAPVRRAELREYARAR
jgi:hypothetical protein